MDNLKLRLVLLPTLLLVVLFMTPAGVESQCNFVSTYTGSGPGNIRFVTKILTSPAVCSLTYSNAYFCGQAGPSPVSSLSASANTALTQSPSCMWVCACGTVTINGNDGLPVELMDFTIEDGAPAED